MTATDTAVPPVLPTSRRIAGIGLATVAGVGVAVQSRINGELGVRLADGIAAAVVSFGLGLLVLLVLVPALPGGRRGLAELRGSLRSGALRPWQLLGGVCGAFLVATQGLTIGVLGVAVFTVAVVAGQSASSLAVDRAGIGPGGRQPVTVPRLAGAVLTVLAVLLAVGDRLGNPGALVLALLPLLAGLGLAWQQAVNGLVRAASGSALTATLVNFAVGTAALLVAFGVEVAVRGGPGWRAADRAVALSGWPDRHRLHHCRGGARAVHRGAAAGARHHRRPGRRGRRAGRGAADGGVAPGPGHPGGRGAHPDRGPGRGARAGTPPLTGPAAAAGRQRPAPVAAGVRRDAARARTVAASASSSGVGVMPRVSVARVESSTKGRANWCAVSRSSPGERVGQATEPEQRVGHPDQPRRRGVGQLPPPGPPARGR